MKTLVYRPHGVHGFGRSRTVRVIEYPLTPDEMHAVVDELAALGISVRATHGAGRVVDLYPLAELTTTQEVYALRAFALVTDARLAWHDEVTL